MIIEQHRLTNAKQIASPNYDDRPNPVDISLLVIHCISLPPGEFDNPYIDQLFCNVLDPDGHPYFKEIYQLTVSAHLLIKRDGSCVQYVPFNKRAWHAGKSNYQGKERCNDFLPASLATACGAAQNRHAPPGKTTPAQALAQPALHANQRAQLPSPLPAWGRMRQLECAPRCAAPRKPARSTPAGSCLPARPQGAAPLHIAA